MVKTMAKYVFQALRRRGKLISSAVSVRQFAMTSIRIAIVDTPHKTYAGGSLDTDDRLPKMRKVAEIIRHNFA